MDKSLYWDESNKISLDYILIYRLRIKYKLRLTSKLEEILHFLSLENTKLMFVVSNRITLHVILI